MSCRTLLEVKGCVQVKVGTSAYHYRSIRYIFSIQCIKSLFTLLVYSTDYLCPFALHMTVIFHFLLQVRVHRTTCSTVCVHVTSSGIIEDCSDMRFAPYNFTYEGIEEHVKVWGLLHTNTSFGVHEVLVS